MAKEDYQSLFKAAKAQRGGGTQLSKEQLRALRASRAKAAAAGSAPAAGPPQSQTHHAATGPLPSARLSEGMPPPPARAPSAQTVASVQRADSQLTVTGSRYAVAGQATSAGKAESTAATGRSATSIESVTAAPAGMRRGSTAASATSSAAASLPEGFFAADAASRADANADPAASLVSGYGDDEEEAADPAATAEEAPLRWPRASPDRAATPGAAAGSSRAITSKAFSADGAADGGQPAGSIPKGFFEDTAADAKARGVAPPKKKDIAEEYRELMAAVQADVREAEMRELEEADAAAVDRQEREAFEQELRRSRVEELQRQRQQAAAASGRSGSVRGAAADGAIAAARGPKRKRLDEVLTLAGTALGGSDADDDSGEEAEDGLMDWRAKAV